MRKSIFRTMSKKSKKGKSQPLSPAAYIRTRARSLPIYKCMVNKDWAEDNIAHVMLSRQHSNGNITMCVYLVDLLSQGVTDSIYFFNEPQSNFDAILTSFVENHEIEFKEVDYALVHNIVYAGVEYAEDLGFMPHKEFTTTTRFMLQEDNDEVELIDIECGWNGKPAYMQSIDDTPVQAQTIIKKLEKAVGPGNYIIMGHDLFGNDNDFGDDYSGDQHFDDEDFDDEDFDDDDDDDDDETYPLLHKYDNKSLEEKKAIFKELYPAFLEDGPGAIQEIFMLMRSITDDLAVKEDVIRYYKELFERAGILEITEMFDIPEELWGINPDSIENEEQLTELFEDISELSFEDPKAAYKMLRKHKKRFSGIPLYAVLELFVIHHLQSKKYPHRLRQYHELYPNNSLIGVMMQTEAVLEGTTEQKQRSINDFFPNRKSPLHPVEYYLYLEYELACAIDGNDISRYVAFNQFIDNSSALLTENQHYKFSFAADMLMASLTLKLMVEELTEEEENEK